MVLAVDAMQATLVAIEYELTPRNAETWWLEIVWRFQNPSERRLHVLSRGPVSMLDSRPFVINHTSTGHLEGLDANISPVMQFAFVEAHSTLDLRRTYPLPAVDLQTTRKVVGKFAVSYETPGPKWMDNHVWDAVRKWQKVLESTPFEIRLATPLRRAPELTPGN